MGPNPVGFHPRAHSPLVGPTFGPKAQPICGLGFVEVYTRLDVRTINGERSSIHYNLILIRK